MKVTVNSVHFKADKKLLAFIDQKIEKLTLFYDGIIGSEVALKVGNQADRENKVAEVRLNIKGADLYAKKQCNTFEEAVDQATDALKKQLTKHKDKTRKKY